MGIIGPGLIGGTLLDQIIDQVSSCVRLSWLLIKVQANSSFKIFSQAAVLKEEFKIDLRVIGITGSSKMLLSES